MGTAARKSKTLKAATLGLVAALTLSCGPATAALIKLASSADVSAGDLSTLSFGVVYRNSTFAPFDISVTEGDIVEWTLRFLPGQSLSVETPQQFNSILLFDEPIFIDVGPMSMTFLRNSAPILQADGSHPLLRMGQGIGSTVNLPGAPSVLEFDALVASFQIVGFVPNPGDAAPTTVDFEQAFVTILGSGFRVNPGAGAGSVPEPATWALMLAGFGAAGAALRRRRLCRALGPP